MQPQFTRVAGADIVMKSSTGSTIPDAWQQRDASFRGARYGQLLTHLSRFVLGRSAKGQPGVVEGSLLHRKDGSQTDIAIPSSSPNRKGYSRASGIGGTSPFHILPV